MKAVVISWKGIGRFAVGMHREETSRLDYWVDSKNWEVE
jgi:hypothetical protein